MNPAEWFASLPTGGKIAVGVGALGVVYYIYKSGGSGASANVLTSPATGTTPTDTTGGWFSTGGGGGVDSSGGNPGGSTQGSGNGGVAPVGTGGVSSSGTGNQGGNQVKPHNPSKSIVPIPKKPAAKSVSEAPHHAAPHKVSPNHYEGSPVGPMAAANRAHDAHNFMQLQHLQHAEMARPIDHYQGSPVGPTAAANRVHDRHNYQQLRQVQHNAMPERKPKRRAAHHTSPHHTHHAHHVNRAAQRRVARLNIERMQNFRRHGY